mmetsp:Transcript_23419/g.61308  ORF Transcript_23419/g.61308 Transcript_23419/m.61308 type:complete len:295 (+) Transcript_23419:35-919(+)
MLLVAAVVAAAVGAAVPRRQPALALRFVAEMHIGEGYGHDGDGCELAEAQLADSPVISKVWFDAPGHRLAQTNPGLQHPDPNPDLTVIGLYDKTPPTEIDIDTVGGTVECQTEPLPPAICKNGSRTCVPSFGDFGSLNAFTSILGMFYYNTTLLERTGDTEVWQWESVIPTKIPVNGSVAVFNVTRNYTYTLSAQPDPEGGGRRLLRFQWTQSIPLRPDTKAHPVHRDCFVFDYRTAYSAGPIPPSRWAGPTGVKCQPQRVERNVVRRADSVRTPARSSTAAQRGVRSTLAQGR